MMKEKYINLVNACKEDADMLEIVNSDIAALGLYVNAVYMMETTLPIIRVRYDGEELRDRVERLDRNRRDYHERAIMGVKRLNRFAAMMNVEEIFDGDVNDRYAIADFCMETVTEIFNDRTGKNFSIQDLD